MLDCRFARVVDGACLNLRRLPPEIDVCDAGRSVSCPPKKVIFRGIILV